MFQIAILNNGTVLSQPESGWQRINVSSSIDWTYLGEWDNLSTPYTYATNCLQAINFTGDKIRLLDATDNWSSLRHNVVIDGVKYQATQPYANGNMNISLDVQNLFEGEHCLEIYTDLGSASKHSGIPCIDIDKDKIVKPYNPDISQILIKQNNNYYCIADEYYNSSTKRYTPLPNADFTKKFNCNSLFEDVSIMGETFRPIDKFDNFQIISTKNSPSFIRALKSTCELIVAKDDIQLSIAQNIDYFKLISTNKNNGNNKIVLSTNKGASWITWDTNSSSFINLACVIHIDKDYELFNDEEKAQWNAAAKTISQEGISPELFNTLDFNLLRDSTGLQLPPTIRFAYAIIRPTYNDNAKMSQLSWQFDAKGSMQLMKNTEQQIDIYGRSIKYKSLIDNPLIKVNVML